MTEAAVGQHGTRDRILMRWARRCAHAPLLPSILVCAALTAITLAACTLDPGTTVRTSRDAAEASAISRYAARRGALAGAQQAVSGKATGSDLEALGIDLANFKERLIGLDVDEINGLMGTPGLQRAEPPALIWQYRHQLCTVDIFMFDDGKGATVDHVDVRPASGGNVDEKECFTALLNEAPQSSGPASAAAPVTTPPTAVPAAAATAPSVEAIPAISSDDPPATF